MTLLKARVLLIKECNSPRFPFNNGICYKLGHLEKYTASISRQILIKNKGAGMNGPDDCRIWEGLAVRIESLQLTLYLL